MAAKIAKGIKGIRRYLDTNTVGWHIFIGAEYMGYRDNESLVQIINLQGQKRTLVGITGNALIFKEEVKEEVKSAADISRDILRTDFALSSGATIDELRKVAPIH